MSEQSGGSSTTKPKTRTITLRRGKIVREFPRRVVTKPLCKDKTGFQKPKELVQEVKRLTKDELEEYTSQITKLYNERPDNFGPFWDPDKAKISDSLWNPKGELQTKKIISNHKRRGIMGKSWFTIEERVSNRRENCPSLNVLDTIPYEKATDFKTISVELFYTEAQKELYTKVANAFRWHLNAVKQLFLINHPNWLDMYKVENGYLRDTIYGSYTYREEGEKGVFEHVPGKKTPPWPSFMKGINKRVARGAVKKFVGSLNSMITNWREGNCESKPTIKFSTKKSPKEFVHFDDNGYKGLLKNVKGSYKFRGGQIPIEDLPLNKGYEICHDKVTDRYFLHIPVDIDWSPKDWSPKNSFNIQETVQKSEGERIISLDPGVRKFMVGYDPSGKSILFGKGSNKILTELLYEIDADGNTGHNWKRVQNLVKELHWKTIKYLTDNYDTILLPDFRISQMVKNKQLPKMVKRLLYMYSFHQFKKRLIFKCHQKYKKLVIVDESYTSKTCGSCGAINTPGRDETYSCKSCRVSMDRDIMASRNILIKNIYA